MTNFKCPKWRCTQYETDQFQATGGTSSKIFDIQNKKFIAIICNFKELYKSSITASKNTLDFLTNQL
jgi:predicted nucleic-acid-binding Zn-ribbon protein